jgi:predicted AAA+ superfamily ATPase
MFYRRRALADLTRQILTREITVLTGVRRVGKTTLLRMLFESLLRRTRYCWILRIRLSGRYLK